VFLERKQRLLIEDGEVWAAAGKWWKTGGLKIRLESNKKAGEEVAGVGWASSLRLKA
jgi:hypothetical protein